MRMCVSQTSHIHVFSHLFDNSRPNARIMLHQPSGGAQGMAADIEM
jgi:ATP-dependent protease ClpP protease subunit